MTDLIPGTDVPRVQRETPGPGGHGALAITLTAPVTETTEVTVEQIEALLHQVAHDVEVANGISARHVAAAMKADRAARQRLEYLYEAGTATLKAVVDDAHRDEVALRRRALHAEQTLAVVNQLHCRDDRYDDEDEVLQTGETPLPVTCTECGQLWPCRTNRKLHGLPEPETAADGTIPPPPQVVKAAIGWAPTVPPQEITYTLRGGNSPTHAVYRAGDTDRYLELHYIHDSWRVGEAQQ